MAKKTLDLDATIRPESLALGISDKYNTWKLGRAKKEAASTEVLNYVFATDTKTTTNNKLPWKNSTTRPKLCQIRDNLKANYLSALFPNEEWFSWIPGDLESSTKEKKLAIESYMRHIFRSSKFSYTIGQLLDDWIDYGNCFADVRTVVETTKVGANEISVYTGPKLVRISPLDIVFDISADDFDNAPCITRTLMSIGQLHKLQRTDPDYKKITDAVLAKVKDNRYSVVGAGKGFSYDASKAQRLTADGFDNLHDYYNSGSVELLEFEGDYFDIEAGKLYENYRIVVVDRAYVAVSEPIVNWTGVKSKRHCGWRLRPDNAWAMGPLDNLVGLQYRLDHLENLKADVFDLIAYPITKVQGYVEEFDYTPGERIYMDADANVEHMGPDTTALNADLQIQVIENAMEELAGAPRQAMGIRTPGEKTAFEVQTLDNASGRLFQNKITYFEENFEDTLMNTMLEVARRNLDNEVIVGTVVNDLGTQEFLKLTREDITAKGRLTPSGARHYAAQAQLVQNVVALSNTGIYQDPGVQAHMSGKQLAKVVIDALNLNRYNVYGENIRVSEQLETQALAQQSQEELMVQAMTPVDQESAQEEGYDQTQENPSGAAEAV